MTFNSVTHRATSLRLWGAYEHVCIHLQRNRHELMLKRKKLKNKQHRLATNMDIDRYIRVFNNNH